MLLQEVRNLDPNAPVFDVKTVTGQIAESLTQDRLIAALSGIFGMIGLFLTCLGIYGSQSYAVGCKAKRGRHPYCARGGSRNACFEGLSVKRCR